MTAPERVPLAKAFAGPVRLPDPCRTGERFDDVAPALRQRFADGMYGRFPEPPGAIHMDIAAMPTSGGERLTLTMALPKGKFEVDAALWRPKGGGGRPLICGLDFIGPAGVMADRDFPLDPAARIVERPEFGAPDGFLRDTLRGTSATNWPVSFLNSRGYAVLLSGYGSWVPDHPGSSQDTGLFPMFGATTGAISGWAWAISRLIDVAEMLPDIDATRISVAGHSRLGKAALWASANDPRISAVFASSSGAAGAGPASHPVGETLSQLVQRFPHWLAAHAKTNPAELDQHGLLALSCPRKVYLSGAEDDLWADPVGSYVALVAASSVWPGGAFTPWPAPEQVWSTGARVTNGPMGFHMRGGGHALLPYDWQGFLDFLEGR